MTREIRLTRGLVAIVDDEDFERLSAFKWRAVRNGSMRTWYAATGQSPVLFMHNMVLDAGPGLEVDHRDRHGLHNTRANLRPATREQQMANRVMPTGETGYRGVSRKDNRFRANVCVGRVQRFVGSFTTPLAAAVAYDRAAVEAHGDFAVLNFARNRDWLFPHESAGAWPPPTD